MERLLVTTALEETWGDGVPVLFLGDWCRLYNRKSIWSGMDAVVADPFGVEPKQKLRDMAYLDDLSNQILTELAETLNKYHRVQYSERYWNILFGHWLKMYMKVAFNRYYTFDQALKKYKISGTTIIKDNNFHLATPDSLNFINACDDDRWNHVFYSRIMTFRRDLELKLTFIPSKKVGGIEDEKKDTYGSNGAVAGIAGKLLDAIASRGVGSVTTRLLEKIIQVIGVKFGRETDAFIISSYLPFKEEVKLQLSLGQIPQIWRLPVIKETKADPGERANLKLNYDNFEGFESFVRWLLPEVIPASYLEGYKNLVKRAEEMPWPKKPKFIFTTNAFCVIDVFKVWTALNVDRGIPYFAGQHGCNYGTHAWEANRYWPERITSDKFITWGWGEAENDIPAFVFSNVGKKTRQFDSEGGLLLIERALRENYYTYDRYYEHSLYLEDQFSFVQNLPEHINQRLTVRLQAKYKNTKFFDDMRWKERCPLTKIEPGIINIRRLIGQSRLIVNSYDSTGMLETLSLNIPTMGFWRNGSNHLLPMAKPYYELLADAGILFNSPELAAKSIARYWDNISVWWESNKVQDARHKFCEKYARTEPRPIQRLKEIFMENI